MRRNQGKRSSENLDWINPAVNGGRFDLFDIRTPASPQDFETTLCRTAEPPREFRVSLNPSGDVLAEITDRVVPTGRGATKTYRIYFLATNGQKLETNTPEKRNAAFRMSRLVTEVTATGTGDVLPYTDTVNSGRAGYYFCVAVNEQGQEAPMEQVVEAP